MSEPQLNSSWLEILKDEFQKNYFINIMKKLEQERLNHIIFPNEKDVFNALNHTPFENIKVVIIGQDPYHGIGQAHGYSFSVSNGVVPPSLKNIFREIESDMGVKMNFKNGNLKSWANQGVLLLNSILTVRKQTPASHAKIGWQLFTDTIIQKISLHKQNIVFLLWGNFAKQKLNLISQEKHYVLQAPHPSPFSAYNGFFGCKHFSLTNQFLMLHNLSTINWCN